MFYAFLFLSFFGDMHRYELQPIGETFVLESDHFYFSGPAPLMSYVDENHLVLVDKKTHTGVILDLSDQSFHTFGEKGQGPQSIQGDVVSIWVENKTIHVIHQSGHMLSRYTTGGEFIESNKLNAKTFLAAEGEELVQEKNSFLYRKGKTSAEHSVFPFEQHQFSVQAAIFGNTCLLVTKATRNHHMAALAIARQESAQFRPFSLEKMHKIYPEKLSVLKEMGVPPESFFAEVYKTLIIHPTHGLIVNEVFHKESLDDALINTAVVHMIDPESLKQKTLYIKHGEDISPSFFYPVDAFHWLVFDTRNDQFFIAKLGSTTAM